MMDFLKAHICAFALACLVLLLSSCGFIGDEGAGGTWGNGQDGGSGQISQKSTVSGTVFTVNDAETVSPAGGAMVVFDVSSSKPGFFKSNAAGSKRIVTTDSDGSFRMPDLPKQAGIAYEIKKRRHTIARGTVDTSGGNVVLSSLIQHKGEKQTRMTWDGGVLHNFDDREHAACKVEIPKGALTVDKYFTLTPYHMTSALPGTAPAGYTAIAGADFSGSDSFDGDDNEDVQFVEKAEVYIALPSIFDPETLDEADIVLMEFKQGVWTKVDGSVKLFQPDGTFETHYIGPDPENPAKIGGSRPWCFFRSITRATVSGRITDASGHSIEGAHVNSRQSRAAANKDGEYTLSQLAFRPGKRLIAVTASAAGYRSQTRYASITPGQNIVRMDFTLKRATSDYGVVQGTVTDGNSGDRIAGAIITLTTDQNITKLLFSDEGTPSNLSDDTLRFLPPQWANITSYEWTLMNPAQNSFTSIKATGTSVIVNQLAIEAQDGGLAITEGAYKVALTISLADGRDIVISGGFLIEQSGFEYQISEIVMPVTLASRVTYTTVTDEAGAYRFQEVPIGQTCLMQADADGYAASDVATLHPMMAGDIITRDFSLNLLEDITAPDIPDGLAILDTSSHSITLSWNPSSDDFSVAGYKVLRNDVIIASVEDTDFIDLNVSAGTTYRYAVYAYDASENRSAQSDTVTATTDDDLPDTTPPDIPTGLAGITRSSTVIDLSWNSASDNTRIAGYHVYRNGARIRTLVQTAYSDTGLSPLTTYAYTVAAFDTSNNQSGESASIDVTTLAGPDTTPPDIPTGLDTRTMGTGQIDLTWNASSDADSGVAGYIVYRDAQQVTSISGTSFSDTGLSPSTTYSYTVAAYDNAGNTSSPGSAVDGMTSDPPAPDTTPPSIPDGLMATPVSTSQINLSWNTSMDTESGVAGYLLLRDGLQIATTPISAYADTGLTYGTTYSYTVAAYDNTGNTSSESTTANGTTDPDDTPPTVPTGLAAATISSSHVDLSWNASTDTESGVAGYALYRNGAWIADLASTSYLDTGLAPSTTYSYTVSAHDHVGNTSIQSAAVDATTSAPPPDVTPPTVPSGLSTTPASSSRIDLAWTASTDTESGVAGYILYKDGIQIGSTSGLAYADTRLTYSTTYVYTVAAYDNEGNTSAPCPPVDGTTNPDITPPTVPTGLTGTTIGSGQIDLSWNASTDTESGTAGYYLYRDGALRADLTATGYSDTGLASATTYSYALVSYDNAGNFSAQSAAAQVTTADENRLMAYWKLDEGAGTVAGDSSGNGHNGMIYGAGWSGAGKFDKALAFDGIDDSVLVGTDIFTSEQVGSVGLWLKGCADTYGYAFNIHGAVEILYDGSNRKIYGTFDGVHLESNDAYDPDRWHHVLITNNGITTKLYVNGVLDNTASQTKQDLAGRPVRIGARGDDLHHFKGWIDEVKLYNYPLTPLEVARDHGLIGWWRFEEGAGATAADSSGTGNHAMITDATWTTNILPFDGGRHGLDLDGVDDEVVLSQAGFADIRSGVTVQVWINPDVKDATERSILDQVGEHTCSLRIMDDNRIRFGIEDAAGTWYYAYIPASQWSAGTWSFLAGTYDGETLKLYHNGELKDINTDPSGDLWPVRNDLVLGYFNGTPQTFTDGRIDEIKIYHYARSAQDIADALLIWRYATGAEVSSSPAIGDDGTVYFGADTSYIYALNPDGALKWSYATPGSVDGSPSISHDGTIYAGSSNGEVTALNPDGSLKWTYQTGKDMRSAPAMAVDGTLYFGSRDGTFYALNPDGSLAWSVATGDDIYTSPAIGVDGTVYFGSWDKKVYAVNPDGAIQWTFTTDGSLWRSPAIGSDGTIYIPTYTNRLYAFNPDGILKWISSDPIIGSPAIGSDGTIYAGSWTTSKLYAVRPDGSIRWSYDTQGSPIWAPAVGADGAIYVGVGGNVNLYALHSNGTLKWAFPIGMDIKSAPTITDEGVLYIGTKFGYLYAIYCGSRGLADAPWPKFHRDVRNAGNHADAVKPPAEKWRFNAGSAISSSPAVDVGGNVYFGSDNGNFYALNPDGTQRWTFATGGSVDCAPFVGPDGTLYVGSANGKLYAVHADGTEKWSYQTGNTVQSTPVIASDGSLYFGSFDNSFYALYPDGTLKWSHLTGGEIHASPAMGTDGTVYVTSLDGNLYAFNQDGSLQWTYATAGSISRSPAIAADGTIYVASREFDYRLYAINPDGTLKWISVATVSGGPSIGLDGTIYAGSGNPGNSLRAVNPTDGSMLWSFAALGAVEWSPAVAADGTIYIGSNDTHLYAINPGGALRWSFTAGDFITTSVTITEDGTLYFGAKDGYFYALDIGMPLTESSWPKFRRDPKNTGQGQ